MFKQQSIDTNIILRMVLKDDAHLYQRAYELLTQPRHYYYVPDQAIIEAVFVLSSSLHFSRANIQEKLLKFLSLSRVDYDARIIDKVFEEFLAHPKLSFVDCYLAIKMSDIERAPLWTLDEKLAKQLDGVELA